MRDSVSEIVENQRRFFLTHVTHDLEFRRDQLRKLEARLRDHEEELCAAIHADFGKSRFETYLTELGIVHHEIQSAQNNLKRWSGRKRVSSGLTGFPSSSFIVREPYGTTLVIGAWNYPYQLTLVPMIAAMAAGNTVVVKPSELSARTSAVMAKIINGSFDSGYLHVLEGGAVITSGLLAEKFDKIFFTGSTAVGKIVAKAAAENLTPVTLELGGKSPCIVMDDVNLARTAQRIVWGKFLNAGQTCIAPDYLLVHERIYEPLLAEIRRQIPLITGVDPRTSESYTRIINDRHVLRLKKLIDPAKVYVGGEVDLADRFIAPTVLRDVQFSDPIMREEIFGPLLPVIPFSDFSAVLREIQSRPRPLALYVFSRTRSTQERILRELRFGGGAINDVVMQITNPRLPFGGVGASGMGSYHGEFGFRTFSHEKSIVRNSFWFEAPVKYLPFTDWKKNLVRFMLG